MFIKMSKTLRGDKRHRSKQYSSNNAWLEIKHKGTGAFGNLAHVNVKSQFWLLAIRRKIRLRGK